MSQQPLQICDNCLKSFPESKIATHFGYCRRNIKKCDKCGEMYDINFLEQHEEEFHKLSTCKYCQKSFKPNEVSRHESICDARTQFCEYCDLDVPLKDYPLHLKECQSRTKQCEKCRKPISNKDFLIHTISCKGIIQEPVISQPTPKYSNYDQYIKENQRKQLKRQEVPRRQEKKYEYKPTVMEQKRQPSRGMQRQRKPQINYLNSRPMEAKRDPVQPYKSTISVQQKPTTNYADINMNKNLPSYGDKRVPNIGQKDKYGRVQIGNRNVDINKNIGSGKVIENKYVPSSRINNEYQPSVVNNYGIRKPSNEPHSKVSPSINFNSRNIQPSTNEIPSRSSQQTNNYPRVQENYKRQIPSNKQVYVKRQSEKSRQPQQKREVNYAQYMGDYQVEDDMYNFKKEDTRKYQQPTRSRPSEQYNLPTGPQSRPNERSRPQETSYVPQQQNSYVGGSGLGDLDEDEELQKAIIASLGNMNIGKSPKNYQQSSKPRQQFKIDDVPADLLENDMLNESFYDKQMALMQEIERNKKRR